MHGKSLFLAVLAISHLLAAAAQAVAAERPNIILILADDLGWSGLGCYGGEIPTSHIDSLAERGLRFAQFYNNAVCGPTRASLLTGLYCQQVGHGGVRWNDPTDFSKCVTIAEVLRDAGYRTMMAGKWQQRDLLGWRVPQNQVARAGKWKVIRRDGGPWELYDLEADGTETKNLAAQFPDIARDLTEKWHRWAERCRQAEPPR